MVDIIKMYKDTKSELLSKVDNVEIAERNVFYIFCKNAREQCTKHYGDSKCEYCELNIEGKILCSGISDYLRSYYSRWYSKYFLNIDITNKIINIVVAYIDRTIKEFEDVGIKCD